MAPDAGHAVGRPACRHLHRRQREAREELIMQTNRQQYSVIHPLSTAHSKLAKNRQPILFFIFREL